MRVTALELTDFRSYATARLVVPTGVVVLLGQNGQGKTNVVEAIHLISTLGSHRVASDAPMVREGAERAVVRALVQRQGREISLDLEVNPGRANRARIAGGTHTRARELLGVLRTVMFSPEDLALVRGEPTGRRRYLDDLLVQLAPRLASVRSDYERVLKQRSSLLRSGRQASRRGGVDPSVLAAWDEQLIAVGAQLMAARIEVVERLRDPVATTYREMSGTHDECSIQYLVEEGRAWGVLAAAAPAGVAEVGALEGGLPEGGRSHDVVKDSDLLLAACREHLQKELVSRQQDEIERGVTLVGPQRHDLALTLTGLPAKSHASHGESWSVALALKLACLTLLREDDDPVLILDDVFAELDVGRRRRLIEVVRGVEQVFVTAAVAEDVPAELVGTTFQVTKGQVVPA